MQSTPSASPLGDAHMRIGVRSARPSIPQNPTVPSSSSSPQTPSIPQTTQPILVNALNREALHKEVVGILATTANGCIKELGYPAICERMRIIGRENAELKRSYDDLKNRCIVQEREKAQTAAEHQARISALEHEIHRLQKENMMLRQTQNLHADEKFRLLDKKYHYVLQLLRDHHAGSASAPDGDQPRTDMLYRTVANPSEESPTLRETIDLTKADMTLESSVQLSAVTTAASHSTLPVSRHPFLVPEQRLVLSDNICSGTARPTSELVDSQQPRPASASLPSDVLRQGYGNSPSLIASQQHEQCTQIPASVEKGGGTPTIAPTREITELSVQNQAVKPGNEFSELRIITQTLDCLGSSATAVEQSLDQYERHTRDSDPPFKSEGSHSTPLCQARERTPVYSGPRPMEPVLAPDLALHDSNNSSSESVSLNSFVLKRSPTPEELSQHGSMPSQNVRVTPPCRSQANPMEDVQSHVNIEADIQMLREPPGDMSLKKLQEVDAMDVDAVEAAISVHGTIDNEEEKEEDEENEEETWDDLTDDEAEKRSVSECVSAIIFDDDNDERHCRLCDIRDEEFKRDAPRPEFSESSMRDLITHLKNEHPKAWEKLRRTHDDPA